jgi:hypothetical protein
MAANFVEIAEKFLELVANQSVVAGEAAKFGLKIFPVQ